ncbi:hypothetical protein MUP32_00970, partial [Candidatus Microgenomates bacterium]|nr:hypothetical protein [Candidatus Microgenomates bacterium]
YTLAITGVMVGVAYFALRPILMEIGAAVSGFIIAHWVPIVVGTILIGGIGYTVYKLVRR